MASGFRFSLYGPVLLFLLLAAGFYVVGVPSLKLDITQTHTLSFPHLLGAVALAWALVQLSLSLLARSRRQEYERQQRSLALQQWETRLDKEQRRRIPAADDAPAAWKGLRKFEVRQKTAEGGGITSFYLVAHDGKALPAFHPGQYLTFQLRIPGQTKPVIRCYSLSSGTAKLEYYRVSIKRVPPPRNHPQLPPGLSSSYFHDQVKEGDILDLHAPGGRFFLDMDKDTPIVLIAGGVGITPLLSMLETLIDTAQHREVWFFYGVRNSREHILAEHLRMMDRDCPNIHLQVCYSHPQKEDVQGRHFHQGERVSVTLLKRLLPSSNYDFFVCGPPPMMESITTDLENWGVPRKHIHFEAFGPASAKQVSHAEGSGKPAAGQYLVEFAKSAKQCQWEPGSGSILELAEANDITLEYGCRSGNCGTCVVAVREGKVDYFNEPGVEPEQGSCLACVARPAGDPLKDRLILDA